MARQIDVDGLTAALVALIESDAADQDPERPESQAALRRKLRPAMAQLSKYGVTSSELEPLSDFLVAAVDRAKQDDERTRTIDETMRLAAQKWRELQPGRAGDQRPWIELLQEADFQALLAADFEVRQRLTAASKEVPLSQRLEKEVRQAVEWCASLPWSYEVWARTPFPADWSELTGAYPDASKNTIVLAPLTESQSGPDVITSAESRLALLYSSDQSSIAKLSYRPRWDHRLLYCTSDFVGYLRRDSGDGEAPVSAVMRRVREVSGCAFAVGLLEVGDPAFDAPDAIFIFDYEWSYAVRWWPLEQSQLLGSLRVVPGETRSQEAFRKRRLRWIAAALAREDFRLMKAGRWFFDSYCGSNQMMQLVQATTVLEILLGDEDREPGKTARLADRYAYLTARTYEARRAAERRFREIYHERSRVVHSGTEEVASEVLDEARRMAAMVIQRELEVHQVVD